MDMDMYPKGRRALGFTLVELLTVITIVGIVMSIGVPSYRSITTSSRLSSEINGLLGDMQYARSAALREGRPVTACISTDGESCTGGAGWHGGWIIFTDANGNATVDAGDTVLRIQKPLSGGDTLQEGTGLDALTYNRAGFALNLPNAGALLTLHDPSFNLNFTRCLAIGVAGMMGTQTHSTAPETCT
jgi:type IV fimbrial biogenesis protein FimT